MATNLWTDVEALARLARSARAAEAGAPQQASEPAEALLPGFRGNGFALASDERPARVVSGDLLDAFPVGRKHLAFVVGDVSGKGAPAGVLGAFTRSLVRHVAPLCGSPGETLTHVNRILAGAGLDAVYVTVFLGLLDVASGRLDWANAGHPPALLFREGARGPRVRSLGGATGPILGILDRIVYGTGIAMLRHGDRLLVYTDGVTEARNARGRFFGLARLKRTFERSAAGAPARLVAAIASAVERFETRGPGDDATLLALHYGRPETTRPGDEPPVLSLHGR